MAGFQNSVTYIIIAIAKPSSVYVILGQRSLEPDIPTQTLVSHFAATPMGVRCGYQVSHSANAKLLIMLLYHTTVKQ